MMSIVNFPFIYIYIYIYVYIYRSILYIYILTILCNISLIEHVSLQVT